jgi:aspartate/methionine/tyrosine aminotransferase
MICRLRKPSYNRFFSKYSFSTVNNNLFNKLGFYNNSNVLYFGSGAVTNTLIALMDQFINTHNLQSKHADHIKQHGIELHHKNKKYYVKPESVNIIKHAESLKNGNPNIIINGRQVGGNYDDIFNACGKDTKFIITTQNGQSSQALYKASLDYCQRNNHRKHIISNIIGIDAAMFVKMSSTDSKNKTILQPGAKWIFGAYSLKDGSGTGISGFTHVDKNLLNECKKFVNFFKLLDPSDGVSDDEIKLNSQTITGKLMKTANNIGGNYGAAIITRLIQSISEIEIEKGTKVRSLDTPLPYGVLHPSFNLKFLEQYVGSERLKEVHDKILEIRNISLNAVEEYYMINIDHFKLSNISKKELLEAARLYWTESDNNGNIIASKHPPTHALAMFERRPSEPLLDDVINSASLSDTKYLRQLRDYHLYVEQEIPLPYSFKSKEKEGWLEKPIPNAIIDKALQYDRVDETDLVSIKSFHYSKPASPNMFLPALSEMGEHAISYMERLGEYKKFYENIPTNNKNPFFNLTIGGVYRDTPPRTDVNASRGYVTHLTKENKEIVASIFNRLGCKINADQVGISPMRAKLALQHCLSLFQPGVVVAHYPNYKSTIDAAVMNYNHKCIEVDVRYKYNGLFNEVKKQCSLPENKDKSVILLLVCPQNPTAISMTEEDEANLHQLIQVCPNLSIIHDIAYQGYHKNPGDLGKRYRDEGMPHPNQVYISILSTSKSMYASGQPALWTADKNSFPFIVNHYERVATGPTSTFVHDLKYYYDTLDDTYMRSVENNLQIPMMRFIDENKENWGVDYFVKPDGPPFITLDISNKLEKLGLTDKGFREITLRLGMPVLVNDGIVRIALTGFDKSQHKTILPDLLNRLDKIFTMRKDDEIVRVFKHANPFYCSKSDLKKIKHL